MEFYCLGTFTSLGKANLRKRQLETVFIEEKNGMIKLLRKKNGFKCLLKQKAKLNIWGKAVTSIISETTVPEESLLYQVLFLSRSNITKAWFEGEHL